MAVSKPVRSRAAAANALRPECESVGRSADRAANLLVSELELCRELLKDCLVRAAETESFEDREIVIELALKAMKTSGTMADAIAGLKAESRQSISIEWRIARPETTPEKRESIPADIPHPFPRRKGGRGPQNEKQPGLQARRRATRQSKCSEEGLLYVRETDAPETLGCAPPPGPRPHREDTTEAQRGAF